VSKKVSARCLNIGNCDIANSMAVVEVDEFAEFVCPECGKPLVDKLRPEPSRPKRKWLAVIGIVGSTAAGLFGLSTLLRPQPPTAADLGDSSITCRLLGLCSSKAINAAAAALDSAELIVQQLNSAKTIAAYRQGTTTLERQLRRLEESGVYGDAQRTSLKALQEKARQALQRLEQEEEVERIVAEAWNDSLTIDQLPRQAGERQRQQLFSSLQAIQSSSFSYGSALALLERLQTPQPSSPQLPEPISGKSPSVGQSGRVSKPPLPAQAPGRPAGQGSTKADQYKNRVVPLW